MVKKRSRSRYSTRRTCRVCGSLKLAPVLSLGRMCVSDFPVRPTPAPPRIPLDLVLCDRAAGGCGLLQLRHTVSSEHLYRNYWYRSGVNRSMIDALGEVAAIAARIARPTAGDFVVDIGANDGTLLRAYSGDALRRVGFEPARNLRRFNKDGTEHIFADFFSADAWRRKFGAAKARVITAIAMFYDLEDPNAFVAGVRELLADDGLFVIQMTHLPAMLKANAFDNICHEHLEYYSLMALEHLLQRHGLAVCDITFNDVNGGSARFFVCHEGSESKLRLPRGAKARVVAARAEERRLRLHTMAPYVAFQRRITEIRDRVQGLVARARREQKRIFAYGASTKGNTLLQLFGLTGADIEAAAERNPEKWGRFTVASGIPIVSETAAREANPAYMLVLPWHFIKEFRQREDAWLQGGGRFVVPMPQFRIIGPMRRTLKDRRVRANA